MNEEKVCEFVVKIDERNRQNRSFVWGHFGSLMLRGKHQDKEYVFCAVCLKNAQKTEGAKFSDFEIKRYKSTVSTTNLTAHLREAHEIRDARNTAAQTNTVAAYFAAVPRPSTSAKAKKGVDSTMYIFNRDLVMWFAKDGLPLEKVQGQGFVDFSMKYKLPSLPDPTTLARGALNDVYEAAKISVKNRIRERMVLRGSITMDMWTDNHKRSRYIAFTLHFITAKFIMESITLACKGFPGRHTGKAIAEEYQDTMRTFEVCESKLSVVGDRGSNVIAACRMLGIQHHPCTAHGLHHLVTTDSINKVVEVSHVLDKCRKVRQALIYKGEDLQREVEAEYRDAVFSLVEVADGLETASSITNELDEEEENPAVKENYPNTDQDYQEPGLPPHHAKLQKDVATRWNSILAMIDSFLDADKPLERLLEKLDRKDLKFNWRDKDVLRSLRDLLRAFQKATEILSASNYPTRNLLPLFHSELKDCLKITLDDKVSQWLVDLKSLMADSLDKRFPLDDVSIAAAILDPRLKSLKIISNYLEKNTTTKLQLLQKIFNEYVSKADFQSFEKAIATGPPSDSSKDSTNPEKRRRLEKEDYIASLVGKHSEKTPSESLAEECQILFAFPSKFTGNTKDVLQFWEQHKMEMPQLAALVCSLYCVPATSVPSEEVFSKSGYLISAKRSNLKPSTVNKLIFIDRNYEICKEAARRPE